MKTNKSHFGQKHQCKSSLSWSLKVCAVTNDTFCFSFLCTTQHFRTSDWHKCGASHILSGAALPCSALLTCQPAALSSESMTTWYGAKTTLLKISFSQPQQLLFFPPLSFPIFKTNIYMAICLKDNSSPTVN